ncbi:MAG: nicotinate-nicotinamide nucleotide adenylyltransferase [Piscirickettsiaceae bacterium]|nr:MAG: nicotinate-nicotinamide nucleotide adenylyltransferase [Piscirickettsiaceae bacterium]
MVGLVGIYGGTFDPIHLGHVNAAREVQKALAMDEVRLVLSARPPHRVQPKLSAEKRFALLKLALTKEANLIADNSELLRSGPSYMVDTLADLRQQKPLFSLALIMGIEAFNGITKWYNWEQLLDLAHIVVTDRAGFDNKLNDAVKDLVLARQTFDKKQLKKVTHGKIYRQNVTPLAISATEVRALLQQNQSVSDMLSPDVWSLIKSKNLYPQVN